MNLNNELNQAAVERIKLEEELSEYRHLFELQQTRISEAVKIWRSHNPGNELVNPDLGKLLGWLIEKSGLSVCDKEIVYTVTEDDDDVLIGIKNTEEEIKEIIETTDDTERNPDSAE